jgi:hypothetical protein
MAGAAIQEAGTRCPPALLAAVRAAVSRGSVRRCYGLPVLAARR